MLYLSYNTNKLIERFYINLISNYLIEEDINAILDKKNVDERLTDIDNLHCIVMGSGRIRKLKKSIFAAKKIKSSNVPVILYDFRYNGEDSAAVEELRNMNNIKCLENDIYGLLALNEIVNEEKIYNKRLENFLEGKNNKVIVLNYGKFQYLDLENYKWIIEQMEIVIQILINRGYKIVVYPFLNGLDSEEDKMCCKNFVETFQSDSVFYMENIYDVQELSALIKRSNFTMNLSEEGNVISASFGIPFLPVLSGKQEDKFIKAVGLKDILIDGELNAGKMLDKVEYIEKNNVFIVEKLNPLSKEAYFKQKTFFKELLSSINISEENKKLEPRRDNVAERKSSIIFKLDKSKVNKLHLGCGRNIMDGWINLDCMELPGVDIVANLDNCKRVSLPFQDNSIDEFFAGHVIEHINDSLSMMQELHRIAKPGAKAVFRCPYGSSDDAYEDPTHIRRYFLNSFGYFSQPFYWRADYGYRGDWQIQTTSLIVDKERFKGKSHEEIMYEIYTYRNIVKEMIVELIAVKPIRQPRRELQSRNNIKIILE